MVPLGFLSWISVILSLDGRLLWSLSQSVLCAMHSLPHCSVSWLLSVLDSPSGAHGSSSGFSAAAPAPSTSFPSTVSAVRTESAPSNFRCESSWRGSSWSLRSTGVSIAIGSRSPNMAARWLKRVWASSWCMSHARRESVITSNIIYFATALDTFHASSSRESTGFGAAPVRWLTTPSAAVLSRI